jgi:hypothetical protein
MLLCKMKHTAWQNELSEKTNVLKELFLIFFVSVAILQASSFDLMCNYTEALSPDAQSYLNIAQGNFDQHPIHKYRVLVPFMAAAVDAVFGGMFEKLRPWTFEGEFSLFVSFWLVNTTLMALVCAAVWKLGRAYGLSRLAAAAGLVVLYTCRWTPYLAGLPLVDSLYCLVVVLSLLALKIQNTRLVLLCVLVGPWAKEAFIFMVPLFFLYAPLRKWKLALWFLFSGVLVFSFRYFWDIQTGAPALESLEKDWEHFAEIPAVLSRLFSLHGIYDVFSVVGLWILVPVVFVWKHREVFGYQLKRFGWMMVVYLLCIGAQVLLSGDLGRMLYLALPALALVVGLVAEYFLRNTNFGKEVMPHS